MIATTPAPVAITYTPDTAPPPPTTVWCPAPRWGIVLWPDGTVTPMQAVGGDACCAGCPVCEEQQEEQTDGPR